MAKPDELQISGQVTVEAQTATALGNVTIDGPLLIQCETIGPGVFIGNNGANSVGPNTGFRLLPAQGMLRLEYVANLSRVYVWAYEGPTTIQWLAERAGG